MTKLRRMEIVLTNPQVVYFPGQVLDGQLQIDLSADMKMRGVRIKCHGKGHVYWQGGGDDSFSASEDYLDVAMILYGHDSASFDQVVLREGNHVFPFRFVLPLGLPGSYEGKQDCYVRYWLKGTIDKPWKFNHEFKKMFTVNSVLDLNAIQGAAATVQESDSKTVCCCCCESDPITAKLRLDKIGYVPGEAIVCHAEINEGAGRGTTFSKLKLWQTVTYRTHGGSSTQEQYECAGLAHGPINPGGTDTFNGERLVVPPLPPSYMFGCNIINIDYTVKLTVGVADTPYNLGVAINVIIGNIPLQYVVQQCMPQSDFGAITNQPTPTGASANFELPPPSYQASVFGKVDTTDDDDKHATGNMSFAPSYTYYDWINPPDAPNASHLLEYSVPDKPVSTWKAFIYRTMTKLRRMEIILTNPHAVYYPGQVIDGQLQIDLSADVEMRGIEIRCRGEGRVYFPGGGEDTHEETVKYLDIGLTVYGNGPESCDQAVLREGNHAFPFQFVLPGGLPGSFEGRSRHGCHVRYWIMGTIDRPLSFKTRHDFKHLFTVGHVLDLNTFKGPTTPVQDSDSKTVCCCCCESDPITATLRLDKTNYVPGEAIICHAEINDGAGRGINFSQIKLLQKRTFKTLKGYKTEECQECARLQHGPINPGGKDVFSGEKLVIPPLPPSCLTDCSIIDIDYTVKLCVDIEDTPYDLKVKVGVIIGTIPLQSVVQQYMPKSDIAAFTNQPAPMGAPVSFNLPPPSYQECVFGKVNTKDRDDGYATGNMRFAPAYVYYDWINPLPVPSAPPAPFDNTYSL